MSIIAIVAVVLTVATLIARYVAILSPLHTWLPSRWQWLPSAVSALCALLTVRLPSVTTAADLGAVVLEAVVLVALAASAGLHGPVQS